MRWSSAYDSGRWRKVVEKLACHAPAKQRRASEELAKSYGELEYCTVRAGCF